MNCRRKKTILVTTLGCLPRKFRWSTIRTFDLGGDKFPTPKQSKEMNPQMGLRAISFFLVLKEVEIFKTQLRAIWRASAFGKTKILFPRFRAWTKFAKRRNCWKKPVRSFGARMEICFEDGNRRDDWSACRCYLLPINWRGRWIFFSIGTNDLINTLWLSTGQRTLTYCMNLWHPGRLRLIKNVVEERIKQILVWTCAGKWAGILYAVDSFWDGMDEWAWIPSHSRIKKIIRESTVEESKLMLKKALSFNTASEVRRMLMIIWLDVFLTNLKMKTSSFF